MNTKHKRIPIPLAYQNNHSSLLLVTRDELLLIARSVIINDELPADHPVLNWALSVYFKHSPVQHTLPP